MDMHAYAPRLGNMKVGSHERKKIAPRFAPCLVHALNCKPLHRLAASAAASAAAVPAMPAVPAVPAVPARWRWRAWARAARGSTPRFCSARTWGGVAHSTHTVPTRHLCVVKTASAIMSPCDHVTMSLSEIFVVYFSTLALVLALGHVIICHVIMSHIALRQASVLLPSLRRVACL